MRSLLANQGSRPAPAADADVDPAVAHRWSALAAEALAVVADRRLEQGTVGFDDLVRGLHRACTDAVLGDDVCRALRSRYRLVLVDEFQDTDPLQWAIFSRAFVEDPARLVPAADLLVVGDPKQAIYRFRGADVGGLPGAVDDPGVDRRELRTNHRSDVVVVRGLNALLRGATFGDPRIAYVGVEPRPDAPEHAVLGVGEAAVQIRWLPRHPSVRARKGTDADATRARRRLLSDLADHVVELLDGADDRRRARPRVGSRPATWRCSSPPTSGRDRSSTSCGPGASPRSAAARAAC